MNRTHGSASLRTDADFRATARHLRIQDIVISYLAPESLIELKAVSTREKDRLDVAALRQIMAGEIPLYPANLINLTPPSEAAPEESH